MQLEAARLPTAKASQTACADRDELYEAAVDIVIREGRGSVSLLQRGLGIGYGRAARLIDYMAEDGIVGTYNGSQAREVLVTLEQWQAANGEPEPPEPPKPLRRNRILPDPSDDEDEPRALLPARVSARESLSMTRIRTRARTMNRS